jgi:GTP-binding protein
MSLISLSKLFNFPYIPKGNFIYRSSKVHRFTMNEGIKTRFQSRLTKKKKGNNESTSTATVEINPDIDSKVNQPSLNSTFREMINSCRKTGAHRKLFNNLVIYAKADELTLDMTVFSLRTLQRMNKTDMMVDTANLWLNSSLPLNRTSETIEALRFLIRLASRNGDMDMMETIVTKSKIYSIAALPLNYGLLGSLTLDDEYSILLHQTLLQELAVSYTLNGFYAKAQQTLELMRYLSLTMDVDVSRQIIRTFVRETSSFSSRKCLRTLLLLDSANDVGTIQILTNAYLKSIEFVKGAVSLESLPPECCPEVAFIGRSNVGKSSLINMICNKKSLAYTSKTPGKTSEFNYFHAQGFLGKNEEKHQFYLVDLPGVGYAEARKIQRQSWLTLLHDYVRVRGTLRLVCHLVDSRHGLLDSDEDCLSLISTLPSRVLYCIVLTKADKRGGGLNKGILNRIRREIKSRTDRYVPIILTSSETRVGGSMLWSVMLDAIADEKELACDPRILSVQCISFDEINISISDESIAVN